MAQIRFRIDTIQPAGADQPVQQCTTLAAVIATEEHEFFFPRQTARSALSAVLLSASARPSSQKLHNATQCFLIYRNASLRRHFFDNVCSFSCISLYREVSSGLLCICLTARRSDTGNPRISCSMAYSSPISFSASSAVALLVLIYTSWILRRA
uniref:Uncharacterized protein n=1 Tax=Escherichia coli TaxID=562 RepID=Q8VR74_ECOLX|nr:unknown [Escherichia coli]